jgi:hypothetical protein
MAVRVTRRNAYHSVGMTYLIGVNILRSDIIAGFTELRFLSEIELFVFDVH